MHGVVFSADCSATECMLRVADTGRFIAILQNPTPAARPRGSQPAAGSSNKRLKVTARVD